MYNIGNIFTSKRNGLAYLLAQVDGQRVALICLVSGNRWTDPIEVFDVDSISEGEFKELSEGLGVIDRFQTLNDYVSNCVESALS